MHGASCGQKMSESILFGFPRTRMEAVTTQGQSRSRRDVAFPISLWASSAAIFTGNKPLKWRNQNIIFSDSAPDTAQGRAFHDANSLGQGCA